MMTAEANGQVAVRASAIKPHILVVEDESALVEILRYNLEKEGFEVAVAADGEEADRVRGLEVGADDYVAKPFSPSELIARVRAVLRRSKPSTTADLLTYAGIVMDLSSHRVLRDGRPIHLGPTEFRLLRFLMERPGRVYSREQLLDAVWGRDIYVEVRTVDVHIRRLRKALNGPSDVDLIRTVRSAGYALDELAH